MNVRVQTEQFWVGNFSQKTISRCSNFKETVLHNLNKNSIPNPNLEAISITAFLWLDFCIGVTVFSYILHLKVRS